MCERVLGSITRAREIKTRKISSLGIVKLVELERVFSSSFELPLESLFTGIVVNSFDNRSGTYEFFFLLTDKHILCGIIRNYFIVKTSLHLTL